MPANLHWKSTVIAIGIVLGTPCFMATAKQPVENTSTPQHIARQFCNAYRAGNLDRQYGDMVSTSLNNAIEDVKIKNRIFSKKYPDSKPPLGDGLPFQSVSDIGTCHAGAVRKTKGHAIAVISYDLGGGEILVDQLVMVQQQGRWKIDDILFGPLHTDDMRKRLQAMSADDF